MLIRNRQSAIQNQFILFYPFPNLRSGLIQSLYQFIPVKNAVLKGLRHFDRIGRTGYNAQITHRTQLKVVNEGIQRFFLFPSAPISNLVMILMVPFGHASSQAVHPVQACSFFSSCVSITSPLNRSGSCGTYSGYCCVIISFRGCKNSSLSSACL